MWGSASIAAITALAPAAAMAQPAPAPTVSDAPKVPAPAPGPTVGEVVVTGEPPALATSIDRRSYNIRNDLQAQSGSIADALRNVPSVEVDVQGNVSLRGDPNVTILIDGKPAGQFEGENKGQALQQLPADRIDRVEVVTNPSAEFRADGTGGIINLITKKARGIGATASLRAIAGTSERHTLSGSAGYNGRKVSITGDAFYRHDTQKQVIDDDRARLEPATGTLAESRQDSVQNAAINVGSVRGRLDYDATERSRIYAEARVQHGTTRFTNLGHFERESGAGALTSVFNRRLRASQERTNGEVEGGFRREFDGEGHQVSVDLSYEETEDRRVRSAVTQTQVPAPGATADRQRTVNSLSKAEARADYVRPLANGGQLKAGAAFQLDDNEYDNLGLRGPSLDALAPDASLTNLFKFKQQLSQAYVTYQQPIGEVTLLAGLRVEDVRLDLVQATSGQVDENDYLRAYPSLHLAWKLSESQVLSASYGRRVQRPGPEEFNAFRFFLDPVTFKAGNPRLKPQVTDSFEVGYELEHKSSTYLVTAYYRENQDVIADVVRDLGGGVFLTTRENVSESRNGGVEIVASGKLGREISYNLSANAYWTELDAATLGFPGKRSATTVWGRANLSWQISPRDFLQVKGALNSKRLTPQGYSRPTGTLDVGYRRRISERLSVLVTAQDVLGTYRDRQVFDTPILRGRLKRDVDSRTFLIGLVWTAGGKPKDPAFDFSPEPAPP